MKAREDFKAAQGDLDARKLVFIDEMGVHSLMNRLYGWSQSGTPAVIEGSTRGKRLGVVGAIALDGTRAVMTFEGTMNGDLFVEYVDDHLGATLNPDEILVMDGARIHKMDKVTEAVARFGATVLILPPYSPELNPIEYTWSTVKARLRALCSPTWSKLVADFDAIWTGLEGVLFEHWVTHSGYAAST